MSTGRSPPGDAGSLRIVTVDDRFLGPEGDGASRAVWDLHRSLLDLGHHPVLATDPAPLRERRWDLAILNRPLQSLRQAEEARAAAGRVVFLGHDLHHRRLEAELAAEGRSTGAARAMAAAERACWRRFDLSLYPSASEVDVVRAAGGRARWFPYYRIDSVTPYRGRDAAPRPPMLLFVGGARHGPNVNGLRWFAEQVLPRLPEPRPRVEVVGDWPDSARTGLEGRGITFAGRLDDRDLAAMRARATALIAPLTYGAGLKCKVIEALASGVPLVTTGVGLQGIDSPDPVAFRADTPEAWVEALREIGASPSLVEARVHAGGAYVRARHGTLPYLEAVRAVVANA